MTKNTKTILIIIGAIVAVVCAVYIGDIIAKTIIHEEAMEAKQAVEKKVKSIDEEKAAEDVAKTIHGFHAFKEKVKDKLNKLDSADKKKGTTNGLHDQ
jgi:phosphate/sulfate permease